jgi:hypothetical protein
MAIIKPGQLSSGLYSISGSFSGSFQGNGSGLTNLPTQSFETGSFVTTSSFNAFTGSYNTGSFTGSFTGSLLGTASYAQTASFATNTISASYALTSSYLTSLEQQIILSGSLKLDPTQDPDPTGLDLDSTVLFQSSSNTALGYDLYIRQNGNLVKWKWIEGILETGLLYGGAVTYSGSNVFVSPGSGIIAEHNATTGSEISPMVEYVTWNAITQSIANIATQQVTYIYIDNTGTLQQQSTRFTSQQYHDYIPLGAVGHFDYTQVSAFGGGVQTAYDQISQISNFVDAFGPLKISGYGLTGQPGSLRLSVGSGTSFIHGGFYQNDPEFPSQITTPSSATASLARVQRSGSAIKFDTNAGNLYTVVDPTRYDRDGDGTLASVGSGDWSIQRVFIDPKTGVLYVYYGQARYTSLLNALQYLPTDPFTEGDTFDFTTFVGFLVLKGNASDITNTSVNSIINGGLFRGSGQGSGGGIALSNLDDLTDVTIVSPTNGQALIYDAGIWKNGTPILASTASYVVLAQTASYVQTAQTASYVLQAVSSSFATSASYAVSASHTPIVIGTTAITSGTDGRVLFQNGGVVQQSANFTYDGTLGFNVGNNTVGYVKTSTQNISGANVGEITNYSLNNFPLVRLTGTDLSTYFSGRIGLYYGNTEKAYLKASSLGGEIGGFNTLNLNAKGALSTDVPFKVTNSAGNDDIIKVMGNMSMNLLGASTGGYLNLSRTTGGSIKLMHRATATLPSQFLISSYGDGGSIGQIVFDALFGDGSTPNFTMQRFISGVSDLTGPALYTPFGSNAATFVMKNALNYAGYGIVPTGTATDHFAMYSADINGVNGTASPNFRTEDGSVIWLGTQSRLFNVTASNMLVGVTSSLALFTSQNITANIGTTTIYAFPTASYEGAFIDYTARSGSNARAGQIMGIRSGSAVNFTETTTTDFGSTTGLTFGMSVSASTMIVSASATSDGWTVKTIIRSI